LKGEIHFYFEDRPKPNFFDNEKLKQWLLDTLAQYGKEVKVINYIFCSDDYVLQINQEYLNHDYYTDIITFPYQQDKMIESDIFISLDRVYENADTMQVTKKQELLRVIVHGVLHLCGLKDKTDDDVYQMRKAEDDALANF
jgi:rRNA maturation RNase YbeY